MTHDARLSEASPAELIEAAVGALGWGAGLWTVELVARDGRIERMHSRRTFGRNALLARRPESGAR